MFFRSAWNTRFTTSKSLVQMNQLILTWIASLWLLFVVSQWIRMMFVLFFWPYRRKYCKDILRMWNKI